ncbi:MAG TPA: hypothetical protein VGV92_08110 [Gammaproteobacteria bacterium]|nr:hypothetical protein [Gammaproteobacteria bacterium]
MPINDQQRDDLISQKTLDLLFKQTTNQNSTTLQSKHPLLQSVVGFFDKLVNSLNKANPDTQIALQKQQAQQGTNLNMMIPNSMMMQAFMQKLNQLLPQLQNLLNPTTPVPGGRPGQIPTLKRK